MLRATAIKLLLVASALLPAMACAFTSSTTRSLNVRGGPSPHFEVQTVLPPSTTVTVRRCTPGWRWCEISSRRARGWVDSTFLRPSPRGRVPVSTPSQGRDRHGRPAG